VIFHAKHAIGARVQGEALVAHDGFSARYDLDRVKGVFSRPSHKLAGQSYVGKILVLDTAKGGVASSWMLHEMAARGVVPLALVLNSVNPILVQGAAFGNVTLLGGLRPRQQTYRRFKKKSSSARGRAAGFQSLDPHPDRLRQDDAPPGAQLGLLDRSRSDDERPAHLLAARAHPRRLERGERPDPDSRPGRGLRRLGGGRR
jgi:predicted aconitase with swiveling domain